MGEKVSGWVEITQSNFDICETVFTLSGCPLSPTNPECFLLLTEKFGSLPEPNCREPIQLICGEFSIERNFI